MPDSVLVSTTLSYVEMFQVGVLKCLTLAEQQNVYLTVATSHHDKLACTSTVLQVRQRLSCTYYTYYIVQCTYYIANVQLTYRS